MLDAELHVGLREVVAIGRRGGYDNDEIAEKLIGVVRDYANDFAAMKLHEAAEDVDLCCERVVRGRAEVFDHLEPQGQVPCADAPIGVVTNCAAMKCEAQGCAVAAAKAAPPVSLDDLTDKGI